MKPSLLLAVLLLLAAVPAAGQVREFAPLRADGNGIAALEQRISVEAEARPLGEALRVLLQRAGVALAFDRALPGVERPVALRVRGERAAEAALRLLRGTGLELRVAGAQAVLVRARAPREADDGPAEPAPARRQGGEAVGGVLVEELSGRPIPGALVVLVSEAGERARAALSDSAGRFYLAAPGPGRYTLQAERVGYAMTSSPALEVAPGERVDFRLAVRVQAIMLEAVATTVRPRCEGRRADAGRTQVVWEEARKALTATAWATDAALFTFRVRLWRRPVNLQTLQGRRQTDSVSLIAAATPFESLPAADLAENGYVRPDGHELVFYAPDAHVLLSDEFLDGHCFRVVAGRGPRIGWLGLSFEPVRGRRLPDVRGTLWLERATAELREMEFSYTGLPEDAQHQAVGGQVTFERLPGGAWIVRRWNIRMPVVRDPKLNPYTGIAEAPRDRLVQLVEHGGEVVDLIPRPGAAGW